MMISKNLSIFLLNIFIFFSLLIRFFAVFIGNFKNNNLSNHFFSYSIIAKKEMTDDIKAIIVIPTAELKIVKIFKKPIGCIVCANNVIKMIDSEGELFFYSSSRLSALIMIEGNYKKWPKLYKTLDAMNLLDNIYYVKINNYSLHIWMYPGVLVQIISLQDLKDFYTSFPLFFKKGTLIDLRNTKRIGISKINIESK